MALADGALTDGNVTFTGVRILGETDGGAFANLSLDPEGIALTADGTLFISSEGGASRLISPFIAEFSLDGRRADDLPVPAKFLPTADG